MFNRILVPVDGSRHATRAVEVAADIAQKYGAELVLMHVMARAGSSRVPPELFELARIEHVEVTESDMLRGVAEEILSVADTLARAKGVSQVKRTILSGDPASMIVEEAKKKGVDLIIMGRRGLGAVGGLLLGSVSLKISQLTECPCMTVL